MANTQSTVTGRTADAAHFSGNPLVTVARAMAIATCCGAAIAQCATTIHGSGPFPGVDGRVFASLDWDPDGAGPASPVLVVGGDFRAAGSVTAASIAAWDPATGTWSALGNGLDNVVFSLAVLPTGELVAGGAFSASGSTAIVGIARWNGSTWQSLGSGTPSNQVIRDMVTMPNGDLIVGGSFSSLNGTNANCVARWNGAVWSAIGSGPTASVNALAVMPNGDLVAAWGQWLLPSSSPCLARWNGSNWVPLAVTTYVSDIAVDPGGNLIAVGTFTSAGGSPAHHVARWDGTNWSAMGSLAGLPQCVTVRSNGQIVVGQVHWPSGSLTENLVTWTGSNWVNASTTSIGDQYQGVLSIHELANGDLIVGGGYPFAPGLSGIGRWNGTSWSALAPPVSAPRLAVVGTPKVLLVDHTGSLVVAGTHWSAGDPPFIGIGRWNGTQWSAIGNGRLTGTGIYCAVELPNGDLVVAGDFTSISGVSANNVARWNGSNWLPLGNGVNTPVFAMIVLANGNIVVGGSFMTPTGFSAVRTAQWNGSSWSSLGSGPGLSPEFQLAVRALVQLPNGDLLAAGSFPMSGGSCIARWDGNSWNSCGFLPNINCLLRTSDDMVFAAGGLTTGQGYPIYQWTGSDWIAATSPLSGRSITSILRLPNGDLLAGGWFEQAGTTPVQHLARWNGSTWSPVGNGISGLYGGPSTVCMAAYGDRVVVGGDFSLAGTEVACRLAEISSSCPGGINTVGNGCASSGGTNTLAARSLPWLGSTLKTRTTGAPATGFALVLTGVTSIPQGVAPLSLLPQGVPGCDVLVLPDFDALVAIAAGTADWSTLVPALSALLGLCIDQQMILIDTTPAAFGLLTASNSLRITIGQF